MSIIWRWIFLWFPRFHRRHRPVWVVCNPIRRTMPSSITINRRPMENINVPWRFSKQISHLSIVRNIISWESFWVIYRTFSQRSKSKGNKDWCRVRLCRVCSSPWLHSRAINTLRNVLSCHDFDQRLLVNDEKTNRNRIARLYLPLLHIIFNHIDKLFDPGNASFGQWNDAHHHHRQKHRPLSLGQLNRPTVTPSDDVLNSNNDELHTETDGTLVTRENRLLFVVVPWSIEPFRNACHRWPLSAKKHHEICSSVSCGYWRISIPLFFAIGGRTCLVNNCNIWFNCSTCPSPVSSTRERSRWNDTIVSARVDTPQSLLPFLRAPRARRHRWYRWRINWRNQSLEQTTPARICWCEQNRSIRFNLISVGERWRATTAFVMLSPSNPWAILEPSKSSSHLRWRKDQTHWRQANTERFVEEIFTWSTSSDTK